MKLFPENGRIGAVDYGTVRIGVAVCDPDWILASPLKIVDTGDWPESTSVLATEMKGIAREERLVAWVVGLPVHADGNESESSRAARAFAAWLQDETGLPTRLFDERFTTVDANRRMHGAGWTRNKKKKRLDAVAAGVLLEAFLEASRYHGRPAGTEIHLDAPPNESPPATLPTESTGGTPGPLEDPPD